MQKYMAMAMLSGLFVGIVISDDLHWVNAVLAGCLYTVASVLARIESGEGQSDG